MKARHQQLIATLTLVLAFSTVLVSSTHAAGRPDSRAGIRDIGSQNSDMSDVFTRAVARAGIGSQNADMSDVFTRAVARAHAAEPLRPDDRAGIRGAGSESTDLSDVFTRAVARAHAAETLRPDDRAGIRGAGPEVAATAPPAATASKGFRWIDAGVGAAATLALILVLAALAVARSSHHRSHAILD